MSKDSRKKLILIDGNALVHRAFHALPPLTSPAGVIVNAVFGFNSILIRIIKEIQPDYIAAAFDLAGGTVRHSEFAEYKAHRQKAPQELYDQITLVKEVLSKFGVPIYEKPGYEADDLIGTMATKAKQESNLQTIIATGDLDTLQLVDDDKVVVFTLKKGVNDTITYDEDSVMERFGLKPTQMNDYKGLKGDPSDNIPGVTGIGEKTASSLVQEYGSIENLYTEIENPETTHKISPKLKEKLLNGKDMAMLSKQLSIIYTDLDIDFSLAKAEWRTHMQRNEIEKAFREYGFTSLIKRLDEINAGPQQGFDFSVTTPAEPTITINNIAEHQETFQNVLKDASFLAVQIIDDHLSCAVDDKTIWTDTLQNAKVWLEDAKIHKAFHYAKPQYKLAQSKGITIRGITFDTYLGAYLLNPEQRAYDLARLVSKELEETISDDPTRTPIYILKLTEQLQSHLQSLGLENILNDIDLPLMPVLARMEEYGIRVDLETLATLKKSVEKELAKLEKIIYELAGQEFNINSPAQLGDILYEKLAISGKVKRTGGGAKSTAAPELEKLRDEHPIIEHILSYRELEKLRTTYIEPFPVLVQHDGRIHTTYDQTGAATGRLASKDPNLQNIPTRTELGQEFRKAFIAEKGYSLLACDYSQLELRLAAHLAHDEVMIEAFRNGEDIHTRTASRVLGVPPDQVTKEMRRHAKVLNFGVLYGMGPLAFARSAHVSRTEAQDFINKYFQEFKGIANYIEDTKRLAREQGFTSTLFGRQRPAQDMHATMPQVRAQAERMAVNHPVQGTGADIVRIAMIRIDEWIQSYYPNGEVRMLLQIHDELLFEIQEDLVAKVAPELQNIMQSSAQLDVPLDVDTKVGDNWAEMKKIGN
jgi:DNA polymerase-1